jgi:hypothetical protein
VKHTLKLHGIIVGHSELEHVERGTGRAWGAFRPGLGYDLVQPVFRLFAQALEPDGSGEQDESKLDRYYKARDALSLALTDASGNQIPTSVIHIADFTVEDGPSAIQLDVMIADESYWKQRA